MVHQIYEFLTIFYAEIRIFEIKVHDLEELKTGIRDVIKKIKKEMPEDTAESTSHRFRESIDLNRRFFQNLVLHYEIKWYNFLF